MPKNVYQAIRAHIAGEYRTGTLHGKEYIVVPVTALVEGVLQGMASEGPELALAEEFGRFPASWDGRPLVMSHPVNDSGSPISANSPEVLETYQIGFLFNSKIDDKKLLLEAWVDPTLMANLNDDSKTTLETLQKGEMIEVSTGYFALIEASSGLHNNQKYDGIQRDIVPDHLAFLPNGVKGACSNEDGCGAKMAANSSPSAKFVAVKDYRVEMPCCDSCAEGGPCKDGNHHMPHANEDPAPTTSKAKDATKDKKKGPETYEALSIANTIPGSILFTDARSLVCDALRAVSQYAYVVGMTSDKVIYEQYDYMNGAYYTYQRSYSISTDGKVTLGDDAEKVNLITQVIIANGKSEDNQVPGNEEQSMTETNKDPGNASAAQDPKTNADPKTTKEPRVETVTNEQGTLEVNYDADNKVTGFKLTPKVNETKKPQSVEEFIAQAPKEMQEVMNSSLKLHNDRKQSVIKALKDSGRCKFGDEYLAAQSLEALENLAELANVPSYAGSALPISANASTEKDPGYTEAPMVFEAPKAANAA